MEYKGHARCALPLIYAHVSEPSFCLLTLMNSIGPGIGGSVIRGAVLRQRDIEVLATRLIEAGLESPSFRRQTRAVNKDIVYVAQYPRMVGTLVLREKIWKF